MEERPAEAADGLFGDPINLAFDGTARQIHQAMTAAGWTLAEWEERKERDPAGTIEAAKQSMARARPKRTNDSQDKVYSFWRVGPPGNVSPAR